MTIMKQCIRLENGNKGVKIMDNESNSRKIILDVSEINTSKEFHKYLMKQLEFPSFYGMNWDAFWDSITGLIEMPDEIIVNGWSHLEKTIPSDAIVFKELLELFNKKYPMWKCIVQFIN